MVTAAQLTGAQKAAILLMHAGAERASHVLQVLHPSEVVEIMGEYARMDTVSAGLIDAVLNDFRTQIAARRHLARGGVERARDLLEDSFGPDRAAEILESLGTTLSKRPFEFMRRADPRQVITFLQYEHPQAIAVVLAHLRPELAAMVLGGLPDDLQSDVARRLATMERATPDVIAQVEAALEPKFSSLVAPTETTELGGVQCLVDVLNRSDRATERLILEGLERADEALADEVRSRLFVFEDIVGLDDRAVQLVLRQVDSKELATALKGVHANVRDKVIKNLSERAAENLAEEIELLGPVRLKVVEEAQGSIVRTIRSLEEKGDIVLSRSNDEFVE